MKNKSETLFETFLKGNGLAFEKIEEDKSPRPDYIVSVGSRDVVFEVKEMTEDDEFGVIKDPANPHIKSHSRTVGEHVRRRIESSRKQVQYGVSKGLPSVLLIYNAIDPVFQTFGTEHTDFIAAMYGDFTMLVNRSTKQSTWFNGQGQMLQPERNTSFSAVGHLTDRGGVVTVTLFENAFAKMPLPFDELPACFAMKRVSVSTEPLVLC